jgi:hypothetical protein
VAAFGFIAPFRKSCPGERQPPEPIWEAYSIGSWDAPPIKDMKLFRLP